MTTDRVTETSTAGYEARMVGLIAAVHIARKQAADGRSADKTASDQLKRFLGDKPEGERELWDNERTPPLGVRLTDRGGDRWVEWTALPDDVILAAVHAGVLDGLNVRMYDGMMLGTDRATHAWLDRIKVHQGSTPTLVLLPERKGRTE